MSVRVDLGPTEATRALLDGAPSECEPLGIERRVAFLGCLTVDGNLHSVMRAGPWMNAESGVQRAGSICVFMDHVLGEPAWMGARPQAWSVTAELGVDIIAPPPWTTTALHAVARSRPVSGGGFTQCEVSDDAGRLIAVGSAWTQQIPVGPSPTTGARVDRVPRPGISLADAFGTRTQRSADGTTVVLSDPRATTNHFDRIHGGAWATLAEMAAAAEFDAAGLRTTGLRICFYRPASLEGPLEVHADPERLGRSFGAVVFTGRDQAGQVCVKGRVTGRRG